MALQLERNPAMLYTRYMVVCGHRVIIRGMVSRQTADMLREALDSNPDDPIGPCEVIEYVTSEPDDMIKRVGQ